MRKIIGFIICMLLITTTGFSVVGINDKGGRSYEENALSFLNNPKSNNQIDEWPMFRHDLNNTGYSTSLAPDDNNVLWSKYIGDWVDSNPTVKDERLYIVGDNYAVHGGADLWCLDPFTGDEIWKTDLPNEFVWGSPTVANDRLYVLGSSTYNLYCVDAATGDILWTYPQYGHCSPMVVDDKVYFSSYGGPSNEGGFFCLNATSGDLIWSFDTTVHYQACTPAIVNGKVYVGNDDGIFYCLDADTGDELWDYTAGGSIWSSPTVADDRVYFGATYPYIKVYCLNANTGDEIWDYQAEGNMESSPAVAYGNVYIGDGDGYLLCLDAETGDLNWCSQQLDEHIWNGHAVADGKVYTASNDILSNPGHFNCLDAFTGGVIWQYTFTTSHIYSSPAVAYGNVYVGSGEDGYIYAFGTPNEPPGIPSKPDGPSNGISDTEYMFNSSTTDPEGDDVYYLFDWGDGNNSGWQGPYASGEEVSASHIWTEIGEYNIRVKAHDRRRESNWSEPLTIHITTLPPDAPNIDGPTSGGVGISYTYQFISIDPDGDDIAEYIVNWGEGTNETITGPFASGSPATENHTWTKQDTYTIRAKAKDISGAESNWGELTVTIPKNKPFNFKFLGWLFERFPYAFLILRYILALY